MKKILLVALMIFYAGFAYADLITFDSGATISDSWLDDTFWTIYNDYNGNIDTDNIKDGAITSDDIVGNTNPLNRDFHNIGEYVYTGILPPTSANLVSTTTAGTAYIANDGDSTLHQVTTSATQKTYTANKDTYVYLDYTGAFSYDEQATGASQPTTPSNSIVLAKVVTDADNITSVTDLRQLTPPNLRVYTDYIQGCVISRDLSDVDLISIDVGTIEFGTGSDNFRRNTAMVNVNFGTTGRGGLDTGSLAKDTYYYIWAYPDPDNATNFEALGSLSSTSITAVTDVSDERLIGWCYAPSTSEISTDSVGMHMGASSSPLNAVSRTISYDVVADAYVTQTPSGNGVPLAISGLETQFYSSGRPVHINAEIMVTPAGNEILYFDIVVDDAVVASSAANLNQGGNPTVLTTPVTHLGVLNKGEHLVKVQFSSSNAGATVFNTGKIFIKEL